MAVDLSATSSLTGMAREKAVLSDMSDNLLNARHSFETMDW
jgi:hypothetical protein